MSRADLTRMSPGDLQALVAVMEFNRAMAEAGIPTAAISARLVIGTVAAVLAAKAEPFKPEPTEG